MATNTRLPRRFPKFPASSARAGVSGALAGAAAAAEASGPVRAFGSPGVGLSMFVLLAGVPRSTDDATSMRSESSYKDLALF
jgi:hypothetical protein